AEWFPNGVRPRRGADRRERHARLRAAGGRRPALPAGRLERGGSHRPVPLLRRLPVFALDAAHERQAHARLLICSGPSQGPAPPATGSPSEARLPHAINRGARVTEITLSGVSWFGHVAITPNHGDEP